MKTIINFIKKDKVERALKTFIEAFSSYVAVNVLMADFSSKDTIKALFIGAFSSAISVAINSLKKENEE